MARELPTWMFDAMLPPGPNPAPVGIAITSRRSCPDQSCQLHLALVLDQDIGVDRGLAIDPQIQLPRPEACRNLSVVR
jgi:hypothetical protein